VNSHLIEIFEDEELKTKIQKKLPYLFNIAELESSRARKIGMQVGSLRENVIIALLIYKFGGENIETGIPITEPEVDLRLFGQPVSKFRENYYPRCDTLFVQVNWDAMGGFYYLPLEVQRKVFNGIGKTGYIKLPKPGTKEALEAIVTDKESKIIEIYWQRTKIDYNPYQRWVDHWREE